MQKLPAIAKQEQLKALEIVWSLKIDHRIIRAGRYWCH